MTTYIFRRILLMIPTLFGISFVVWLVMALAPGRLGQEGGGIGSGKEDISKDPTKLAQENEAEAMFRRQFGLDRPRFVNTWYSLTAEDLRVLVLALHYDDIKPDVFGKPTVEDKRKARNALEDYGYYAVPPLIELVNKTSGAEQTYVRYWLGRSAIRRKFKRYGAKLDEVEITKFREWTRENRMLSKWTWDAGAGLEARKAALDNWNAWFEENKERWEYSGWKKFKITLGDTQFGTYWGRLLKGDLGVSKQHRRPVSTLILERMRYSLSLNCVALLIAYVLAIPLGVFTAAKQGSYWDRSIGMVLFMLYSLPSFFIGTLLIQWLAAGQPLKIFPAGGFESEEAASFSTVAHFKDIVWHITLPLICLTYGGLAFLSRYSRSSMLDVIRSDYVRTARAKGLSGSRVVLKHVVRNGILPIVTLLGGALPVLIGGSVIIEYLFNINGMGMLIIKSVLDKDFNVVMGIQLIVGVLTMIGILLADIAYAVLDPRISLS